MTCKMGLSGCGGFRPSESPGKELQRSLYRHKYFCVHFLRLLEQSTTSQWLTAEVCSLTVLKSNRLRPRCWQEYNPLHLSWGTPSSSPSFWRGPSGLSPRPHHPSLCLRRHRAFSLRVCLHKDTSHVDEEPTHAVRHILTKYLGGSSLSKHTPRYPRPRLQFIFCRDTTSPQQLILNTPSKMR